mgnify:FL=1
MTDTSYVYDTYALIEIIDGNPNYIKYTEQKIIINEFVLTELCVAFLRKNNKELAFQYVDKFAPFVVSVNKEVIKKAMVFRLNNQKKNLSSTDCIGYFLAKDFEIKFLTGDKEFKNMENVEFVK